MTRPGATYPSYYVPEGVETPQHMGWHGLLGGAKVVAESPDGGIGLHWSSEIYEPVFKDAYVKTESGWYVFMGSRGPSDFARMETVAGPVVKGAYPGQVWMVPQLLRLQTQARIVSAVPEIMTTAGWVAPRHLRGVMEMLRAIISKTPDRPLSVVEDPEGVQLAIDILAINYAISRHEMAAAEWLSTAMVCDIITAASGAVEAQQLIAAAQGA